MKFNYVKIRDDLNLFTLTYFLFNAKKGQTKMVDLLSTVFGIDSLNTSNSSHVYCGYEEYESLIPRISSEISDCEQKNYDYTKKK